jgi:hypothetical protein
MKDLRSFFDIQQADFEKKRGNLALTTLVSLAGLGALIVIEALVVKEDDEDQEQETE